MTYYLFLRQEGQGCDYTIGCGMRLIILRATTLDEAKGESKEYFDADNYGYGRGDYALSDAMIMRCEFNAMPILNKILKDEREAREKEQEQNKLNQERAEFERLKKKFGG